MTPDPPLLVILGPTGAGKSDLALSLAERYGGEIVNCDSVQLYRGMDIGTAKTPRNERRGIPHHLIDILDPREHFTAGDYARIARPVVRDIAARGRVPIVVGGTGFYVRALLEGLSPSPERDPELRRRLAERTPERLHRILHRLDAASAALIHPHDKNKLIRAVEIRVRARKPRGKLFEENRAPSLTGFRVSKIGLDPDRNLLAERLNRRCARMFAEGLIEETEKLLAAGVPPDAKALISIGYREAVAVLRGQISPETAVGLAQAATRQYAKRQRTWFRKEPNVFSILGFGNQETTLAGVVHHLEVGIRYF